MNCLFCTIIAGDIPAHKVYEDEQVLAFLDIYPKTKGHTLVIPKRHADNIYDIDTKDLEHVMHVAQEIAKGMKTSLDTSGVNMFQSSGAVAQQEIMHYHMHVIPRYDDEQQISFATTYNGDDFESLATNIIISLHE